MPDIAVTSRPTGHVRVFSGDVTGRFNQAACSPIAERGDACGADVCTAGAALIAPPETHDLEVDADNVTYHCSAAVRGSTGALPVGPFGGNEACFDNFADTTLVDPAVPGPGHGYWYLLRGENARGLGTFGSQSDGSPSMTTTCQ